ncbi:MAG: hypothetical protein DRG78_21230 [Epsilonproteobacteria bacterium]|nr:MAG: hypothetical protein DRG78_21230 [Campylobacterota bacterium]
MKIYILAFVIMSILFTQGCSQKKVIKPIAEPPIEKPKQEKILEVKNLDELDEKVAIYLNILYAEDIKEPLVQNIHYDLEYVTPNTKTYIFVKFKNSFMFCGSGGCSAKMLEHKNDMFEEIESFTLIKSSIYLIHEKTSNGFSKVAIPVSYIDGMNWATYYNIYEPFSQNEIKSIFPKDIGYKELKIAIQDRKKSIKLFGKAK